MGYDYYFPARDVDDTLKNINNRMNCHDTPNRSLVFYLSQENMILANKIKLIESWLQYKKRMRYEIWKLLHDSIDELNREIRVNNYRIKKEMDKNKGMI